MHERGLLLALILSMTMSLRAADSGTYLNFEVSYNIANDLDTGVIGPGLTGSGKFHLDPGLRIGIGPGFVLNRLISLELETGFIYNGINNEGAPNFEAWYGHVPILANLLVRYDFEFGLTPFIGIGGGGAASIFDLSFSAPGFSISETNVKFVGAGQGIAGLRYRFNENLAIGVIYKYFATSASKFEIRDIEFDFDPVRNHSIGVQLNYTY